MVSTEAVNHVVSVGSAATAAIPFAFTPTLQLALVLFALGFVGVLVSRHLIRALMCVELMLNAVNLVLITLNAQLAPSEPSGQIFAIFVLSIAAAESAVGLALVLAYYKQQGSIEVAHLNALNG
jgi:NAD(P)H-quinone oxidoreductase subunit 4L